MNTILQEILSKKDEEIEQVKLACENEKAELEKQIIEVEQKRDRLVEKLRAERDAVVMKEKLKAFPAELVNNHKTCSICGAEMRPFNFVEGDKVVKAWACQAGNLSALHDLIRV